MLATGTWAYRDRAVPLAKIERLRRLAWLIDAIGRVPGTRFRFATSTLSTATSACCRGDVGSRERIGRA